MATTHLHGRMPHSDIATLFEDAAKCKTVADVEAVMGRVPHLARIVASLTAEFRASLPAGERKRGGSMVASRRDPTSWRPVADSDAGQMLSEHERCLGRNENMFGWNLQRWVEEPCRTYDDRPELIISLLSRDGGCAIVREMVDGGLDLRNFFSQRCHVGGGLHLLSEIGVQYVLLNQLLLAMKDGERITNADMQRGVLPPAHLQGTAAGARRVAAQSALREAVDAYDNRSFRHAAHCDAFRDAIGWEETSQGATAEDLRAFCSSQFELLYRAAHVCLYNELRHGEHRRGRGKAAEAALAAALEDSSSPYPPMFPLEAAVANALAWAIASPQFGAFPPIEGVKREELARRFRDADHLIY